MVADAETDRLRDELERERSRRCEAEAEVARLRESLLREGWLSDAQAIARVGSWEWDLERAAVTWSAELYRLHGLEAGADLGVHDRGRAMVHPDDRARVDEAVSRAVADGAATVDYRIVRPDGVVRHLHGRLELTRGPAGQPAKVTGTAADVTELVTERALQGARADFRRLLDDLPTGIVVDRDGTWAYVNHAFAEALGRRREELIGHSPLEFVHPDDRAGILASIDELRSGNLSGGPRERRYLRPDGQVVVIEVTPSPLTDFEGEPALLLKTRNMTEHRRLIAKQLMAERLVSVGTLAAGVAHEINNPLQYVMANLDLIGEELRGARDAPTSGLMREIEELAGAARDGADRVRQIVRGLKALSGAGDEQGAPVELHRVLEASIRMANNEIRHRARLVRALGAVPRVMGDEARLGQVFINLLVNAAQAIPPGDVARNEIRVVTRTDGEGRAVVEIHDTGPGITPDLLPRLFDPFFTTKEVGGGSGLGLSICHGIVTALGGSIEVDSAPGKGSCFRVQLPAAAAEAEPQPTSRLTSRRPPSRRARVLIVDDDVMVRQSLRRVLRDHDVTLADSGTAALLTLRADASFDAIVCDLMMPQGTGMDLHRELSRFAPELADRMVFVTGGAFTPAARAFLEEVPNHRLEKPFEPANLRAIVEGFARLRRT